MIKEPRAVIDTNVIISAVIGRSPIFIKIYNAFVNNLFTPILSPESQAEILAVIKKPRLRKYLRNREIKRLKELILTDTEFVIPTKKLSVCRDKNDNFILEMALEANADFIVTSDNDLLTLKYFSNIPIVTARQFLKNLTEAAE